MPQQQMVLGALLVQLELSQASFARSVGISPAALNKIICHGEWPKKKNRQELEQAIKAALTQAGAKVEQAELAFIRANTLTEDDEIDWEPEMLSHAAKQHWKISRDPFQNELNSPEDVYLSKQNRHLLAEMNTVVMAGSMCAVIGPCGSGKTTLKRWLMHDLATKSSDAIVIEPRRIDKRKINADGISQAICRALQLRTGGMSGEDRDAAIEEALIQSTNNGHHHVLIIDEAHDLTKDVIKLIKRVWELTAGFSRVMGVILIGQPELRGKLKGDYVREFTLRCAQYEVQALDRDTAEYIGFKLGRVGLDASEIFDEEALKAIHSKCVGLRKLDVSASQREIEDKSFPLAINSLVTNALNVAAEVGETLINEQFVLRHVSLVRRA